MKDNLRSEKRIPAKNLPKELEEFFITPDECNTEKVKTVDASYNGFGFTTSIIPEKLPNGSHMKLYPLGISNPLYARVIYKKKEGHITRVGVQLIKTEGYKNYLKKIKQIYKSSF